MGSRRATVFCNRIIDLPSYIQYYAWCYLTVKTHRVDRQTPSQNVLTDDKPNAEVVYNVTLAASRVRTPPRRCGRSLLNRKVMMMNILGISGTPRKNGNSEILLRYALHPFEEQGWQVKCFLLSELTIQPCRACEGKCRGLGNCVIDDDMHYIYEAYPWCDAVLISSPVYSRNICSQLMAVLDRYYAVHALRPLAGKVGGAIAVGRGTCGGQAITINAIYNWMLSCGVICVPGELNGVTAVASEPGDVLNQEKRLRQAEVLGSNVLNVAERLRSETNCGNCQWHNVSAWLCPARCRHSNGGVTLRE